MRLRQTTRKTNCGRTSKTRHPSPCGWLPKS
ncbi:TPA: hypothetical protein N0F65_001345 [Lagenidium giganteum]|uniref:Uncharacterized protein n=1 Tax=Lagenidium giganteum TaxID=4803 RepID=A0AAV2YZB1_9STRA|nr:TPA: hypothetical protein N0F65_001345 [Lagenidium giganteum]